MNAPATRQRIRTAVESVVAAIVALGATLLLTSATAYAECAWVLWNLTQKGEVKTWTVHSAYKTKEQCEDPLGILDKKKDPLGILKGGSDAYRCLPDTIDPRSPKAR